MGGGSDDMCIFYRIFEESGGNKSCRVSHVYHKEGANLVGNLTHALVVPFATVGRATADNELRLMFECETFHLVVVHTSGLGVEVVAHWIVENT